MLTSNALGREYGPHALRRSFVTGILAAGNDLSVAATLAGPASVETTRRYDWLGDDAHGRPSPPSPLFPTSRA